MARVYLKGLPQLKAKLIMMKQETMHSVRPAMEMAAQEIVDMMKRLVPIQHGDLQDSIGWTWGNAPKRSISFSKNIAGNKITIFAGNEVAFYARWIEFGTAPHINEGRFQGTEHPGTPPRPFFYPAFRALRKKAKLTMAKAIRQAVRQIAKS
jgi:HK97 gp10 family phage protein